MSMRACEKCWDNPCRCGHEYRNWSLKALLEMKQLFERLLEERQKDEEHGDD